MILDHQELGTLKLIDIVFPVQSIFFSNISPRKSITTQHPKNKLHIALKNTCEKPDLATSK